MLLAVDASCTALRGSVAETGDCVSYIRRSSSGCRSAPKRLCPALAHQLVTPVNPTQSNSIQLNLITSVLIAMMVLSFRSATWCVATASIQAGGSCPGRFLRKCCCGVCCRRCCDMRRYLVRFRRCCDMRRYLVCLILCMLRATLSEWGVKNVQAAPAEVAPAEDARDGAAAGVQALS